MDTYLDYLFLGTILTCAGGNIAMFGSGRLLRTQSGKVIWIAARAALFGAPVVLFFRTFSWEVIAASAGGALIGAFVGRALRTTQFEFGACLVALIVGTILLVQSMTVGEVI